MNGIKLLLFLVASAQVEAGTERDYGWAVNKEDGVLEYIVQINPDKKRVMEQQSVQFPNGQESTSNMPRELVGRASRVVVRFGNAILPREPSLQDLDRTQRLFEQPGVSAAAMLGPGRLQDVELPPVRSIQGQGSVPAFPSIPSGLSGGLSGSPAPAGSLADQVGQTANSLRNDFNDRLSDALPDSSRLNTDSSNPSMPVPSLPDSSMLAQNTPSQLGGGFLNDPRIGGVGTGSKYKDTAPAANPSLNPATNLPARMPEFPPASTANSTFPSGNPAATNSTSNRNTGLGNALGSSTTAPLYPADRLNPPSLNTQSPLPQQRTPSPTFGSSPGFGTSPGLAGNATNDWNTQTNQSAPNYPPSMSQPNDRYNYAAAQNQDGYQNPTLVASNSAPYVPPLNTSNQIGNQASGAGLSRNQTDVALAVYKKFDKNNDGQLTADEYTPGSIDGILLTLFVVSLLVNLYLGHLIRKLLMRYRSVLTNVRTQAAYT